MRAVFPTPVAPSRATEKELTGCGGEGGAAAAGAGAGDAPGIETPLWTLERRTRNESPRLTIPAEGGRIRDAEHDVALG